MPPRERMCRGVLHFLLASAVVSLTALGGWTCTTSARISAPRVHFPSADGVSVRMVYLGTSGFYVEARRGAEKISLLTSPFFSNPDLGVITAGSIEPSPTRIESGLQSVRDLLGDVTVLLVGHAHYDHLLDVPYVLNRHALRAKVMGNRTAMKILSAPDPQCRTTLSTPPLPCVDPGRFVDAEAAAAGASRPGRPVCFSSEGAESCLTKKTHWRILPLLSEHAPHLRPVKLYGGEAAKIPPRLPRRAEEWVEGQTLAYLIDVIVDGEVRFRIHFQDAVSTPPLGFPPDAVLGVRRIDAAVLCVPGYQEVDGYPQAWLHKSLPRTVILSHWESFFEKLPADPKDLRPVPFNDPAGFLLRLKGVLPAGQTVLPAPGTSVYFGSSPDAGGRGD